MKYIMFEQTFVDYKIRIPILFPNRLTHSVIYESIKDCLELKDVKLISAGEYNILTGVAGGSSTTLKLKALPDDENIINGIDYVHGIVGDNKC